MKKQGDNITQKPSGKWVLRYSYVEGNRRVEGSKTFDTYKEALAAKPTIQQVKQMERTGISKPVAQKPAPPIRQPKVQALPNSVPEKPADSKTSLSTVVIVLRDLMKREGIVEMVVTPEEAKFKRVVTVEETI